MRTHGSVVSPPLRLMLGLMLALSLPACGNASSSAANEHSSSPPTHADVAGRVIRVADGDTLTILTANQQQQRIRLAEIDSPERRQPWGGQAKRALSALTLGKSIRLSVHDIDRYGRIVAIIYVDGHDINAEMVRRGHAWVYRRYLKRPALIAMEEEARRQRQGLWALPPSERMAPWQWRQRERDAGASPR